MHTKRRCRKNRSTSPTVEFLPVHRHHAEENGPLLRFAENHGQDRLAANHRRIQQALERIIPTLEALQSHPTDTTPSMAKVQLPQSLAQATLAKQAATMARATTTLARLERRRQPVSFVAVAKAAHVSRSWLYHQPELRADIEQLRTGQPPPPSPPAQRATIESLQHQIQALRLETSRLRQESQALRDQLARNLGHHRQAALGGQHLQ